MEREIFFMTPSENIRRAVQFETPDWVPMTFHIAGACWHHYDQNELEDLIEAHPRLFPGYKRKPNPYRPSFPGYQTVGEKYRDPWGCVWETTDDGITGTVTEHPLADWSAFDDYQPPDPAKTNGQSPLDWGLIEESVAKARENERMTSGGLQHGHTFLQLCDIRGYENLIFDMVDEEPRLWKLIEMVEAFNLGLVSRYVDLGVEWIGYPEDLGMQVGPMLSPEQYRTFIKPSVRRLMQPAREAGCIVHMHSDGDIRDLLDDLIDEGVQVMNLQDLVNGIDWIRDNVKGRVCIDLDVDRQDIVPLGTPEQVDALIREEVEKLGSAEGGLTMIHGMYPGVPLENARALMDAMERYMGYWT
jgi:uroporphyrinogen decarboxylase